MTSNRRRAPRAALSVLATAVLLAGCATSTPSVEPGAGVRIPGGWSTSLSAPVETSSRWWESFRDPLLPRMVAIAVEHSTAVASAQASVREARALRTQAAAAMLPSLSAVASAHKRAGSNDLYDASLDARWEAGLFGATAHSIAAQGALVRAASATLESVRVSVAAETALACIGLRNAQVRAAIARQNLEAQQETLQIARWREQAGLASSLEVEQAKTSVEQTRAQIPLLEASAATSAHAIAVLTGQAPGAMLAEFATTEPALPHVPQFAVASPVDTLRHRPDVAAAEQRVRAAAEQVGVADANRYPGLTLTGSAQWSGVTLGSLGEVAAARSIIASLTAALFDAGLRSAQLEQRRAQFDAAQQDWRAAVLGALQEVEDALTAVQAAEARLVALRGALDSARNASMLATHRYSSGVIDFLTVLETQRTLLGVQDGVAAAEAELAQDQVRLFKALGGLS